MSHMPTSGSIHPQAQSEYADIKARGNSVQRVVTAVAWADAVLASRQGDVRSLMRSLVYPNGRLFKSEHALSGLFGGQTLGVAVVGVYGHADCVDVLACDVSASPWWHGSSPEVRAGGLLP